MFDFSADPTLPKPQFYADLLAAADALTHNEADSIANMANIAALLGGMLEGVNWAGFYRMIDEGLVLGPFYGQPACIRIPLGQGVCGVAAASGETQLVPNVGLFPGHIACDTATQSELVVPVLRGGKVIAVIDLDSPDLARFDLDDQHGIENLAQLLCARI